MGAQIIYFLKCRACGSWEEVGQGNWCDETKEYVTFYKVTWGGKATVRCTNCGNVQFTDWLGER